MGRFPHLIWADVACGGAAMVAGGGRLWCSRWRHCGARRRPALGEKGRGRRGGPIPLLTSSRDGARRRLRGGRREAAAMALSGGAGELVRGLADAVRFMVVAEHDVKAYL